MSLIKNVEFRNVSNTFQEQLAKNIKQIKCTNKVIVPADKTRNLYKVEKEDYKKYLRDNITKIYKKSTNSKVNRVHLDAKKVADKLLISARVDQLQKHDAYITVKDHKESFTHNPSFRLINPSKSYIGKVSKTILDQMNKEITSSIQVNLWKNALAVVKWFRNIENKPSCSFIIFDIQDFSLSLFNRAIEFGKEIYNLSNDEISIIMQSR